MASSSNNSNNNNSSGGGGNSNKIMTMSTGGGGDRQSSMSRNVSAGCPPKRGIHHLAGTRSGLAAASDCCQSDNSVVDDRSSVSPRFVVGVGGGSDRLRSRSEESLLEPSSSILLLSEKYHTNDRR